MLKIRVKDGIVYVNGKPVDDVMDPIEAREKRDTAPEEPRPRGIRLGGKPLFNKGKVAEVATKTINAINPKLYTIIIDNEDGHEVSVETDCDVEVAGDAANVYCDDLECGKVLGNVTAKGDVDCKSVHGNVLGYDIECGDVGGDVTAKSDVSCKKVKGNVKVGGSVYEYR